MIHKILTSSLLFLSIVNCSDGVTPPYRTYWYSPYGPSDYGRQLSFGKNLGQLTTVQCSRFCSDSDSCQAYEFHKTNGRLGTCYTFTSLTYNTIMVPAPGHKYYEKRNCFEVFHFSAAILYPPQLRLILFSGETTFIFDVIESGTKITFRGLYLTSHTNFFPGLTGTVDGAFIGPSDFTYIVQGNVLKCYNPVNAINTLFEECGPTNAALLRILDPYFAIQPYLDAVVSIDTTNDVHVIADNTVYRLMWSNPDNKYNMLDSFPLSDTGSNNLWVNAPVNMTAMSRLVSSSSYLVLEDYKVTIYNTVNKVVTGILIICKY